jgi:HEAT repeat protein
MWRLACLLASLLAAPGLARPDHHAEAQRVLEALLSGAMGVNQAANRLSYLGEAAYASSELCFALRRASSPRARAAILEVLVSLGVAGEDTERAYLGALDGDDVSLTLTAVRGLGTIKSAKAQDRLRALLEARSPAVRREAAKALGALGAPRAAPALMKAAKAEDDLEARHAMLVAVGRSGDARQAGALEALLTSDSETTRFAAARALCLLGAKAGAAYARRLLASAQPTERLQGVRLFEGASARVAAPVLDGALRDEVPEVRATAAGLLAQGGDTSKVTWLVLASARATGREREMYEAQLEPLRLTDEARRAILTRAGLR